MAIFSERHNIVPKKAILLNDITREMRIGLWNAFYKNYHIGDFCDVDGVLPIIWEKFLKLTLNRLPHSQHGFFSEVQDNFFSSTRFIFDWLWWKVFDFIEFVNQEDTYTNRKNQFRSDCNLALEQESSGYRFIE
jgi:hypothetical protein